MEVNGQFNALAPLPPEKEPLIPTRRLDGPQCLSRLGGEVKNSQPLPGLEPPIILYVIQGYTTELSRLVVDDDNELKCECEIIFYFLCLNTLTDAYVHVCMCACVCVYRSIE
jgi:hypothetical protein